MLQVRVSYRVSASTEREVCKSRNLPMHEACSGLESLVLVPLPLSLCSQLCLLKGAFRKAGNQGRIHICWGRRPEGKAEETHTLNDGASPGTLKCQAHWRTITNSLRLEGTSEDCLSNPPALAEPPWTGYQDHVQSGFAYLQGRRLRDISGKPVPLQTFTLIFALFYFFQIHSS